MAPTSPPRRPRAAAVLLSVAAMLLLALAGGAAFGGARLATAGSSAPTGATASATAPAGAGTTAPSGGETRIAGADRYATAAALSRATFRSGAQVAFLATGADFPDALTAAAAAGGKGPVLLTATEQLPAATATELQRLHPSRVLVVGGSLAVPDAILSAVRAMVAAASVQRVSGPDRYETAALLSQAFFSHGISRAYVATGTDYPDALAAAAAAGGKSPVLLAGPHGLPSATASELSRLHPSRVLVVGGTLAVPSSTKAAIESLLPSASVRRTSGPDRFATAARLSSLTFPSGASVAYVATGGDYPDALASAAAAASHGPVLLVQPDQAPDVTVAELHRLGATRVVVVGGADAVSVDAASDVAPPTTTTSSTTTSSTSTSSTSTTAPPSTTTTLLVPTGPAPLPSPKADVAVQTARAQLGKPYQWGGAGPDTFDCSGLTMYAWAPAGVALPHNAAAQARAMRLVKADVADLTPGDLLFYDSPIDHVAMYVGSGQMIEAAHTGVPVRLVQMRTSGLVGAGRPEP